MATITRNQLLTESYRAAAFLRRLHVKMETPRKHHEEVELVTVEDAQSLKLWACLIDVLAKTYRPVKQPVATSTGWDRRKL